jgi:regulator of sirC expression with transglutaminase-like and TPR domain
MDKKETQAIIKLLDDPDENIFLAIKDKLKNGGPEIVPFLEDAWERSLDPLFQKRIENIVNDIHVRCLRKELKDWVASPEQDLVKGASIIAGFQYPDYDFSQTFSKIEQIKKDVWLELNDTLTALEKVKIVNHVFFEIHGFSRNLNFQRTSAGFFLNQVVESKKGAPVLLSIVYAGIAQQLNLPVFGVALARNFILAYKDTHDDAFSATLDNQILFYINPFNKGIAFGKDEIDKFLKQQKLKPNPKYYEICSNLETIKQLVKQVISYFKQNQQTEKVELFSGLLDILYF